MTKPPSLLKRLGSNGWVLAAASTLITLYIRFVAATTRFEMIGRATTEALIAENKGVIFAYWHQRMLMGPVLKRETGRRVFQLSSNHRDAELIAHAVKPFGIEFIRGSAADPKKKFKDKGGAGVAAQMIAVLKEGHCVSITPDGPRGPARRVHPGILRLAQISGAPILPGAYSTSRGRFLDTWDRFLLALPFSRAAFVCGDPIRIPADATPEMLEEFRVRLEAALDAATDAADRAVGQSRTPRG